MKISFKKIGIRKYKEKNKFENEEIYNNNLEIKEEKTNDMQSNTIKKRRRKGAIYSNETFSDSINKVCLKESKSNFSNFLLNKYNLPKKYYALFFATVVLGLLSVYMLFKTHNLFSKEDYEVYKSIDNTNNEEEILCTLTNQKDGEEGVKENKIIQTSAEASISTMKSNNNTTNKKNETITEKKIVPLSFSKPLNGEVLKPFSIDKIIYSKTLELWKTHDGIDIKASAGTSVKSIEKGVVEKVYNDSFYGMSVVIDHSQGYKSVYANLGENIPVKVGQSITKGKVIGKVSNTAIGEIKDEPHLHFMLYKNNEVVDPTYIFGL